MLPVYENFKDMYSIFESRGIVYPMHLHTHLELYYALKSGVEMTIGEITRHMAPGDLGVAFPHRLHGYQKCESSEDGEGILAICPANVCPEYASAMMSQHPENPFLAAEQLHPETHRAFGAMMDSVRSGEPTDVARAYVHLILARTLPLMPCRPNRDAHSTDETLRIIEYVGANFAGPLSLTSIGRALGISPFRISRVFSGKLNCLFSTYVNALRIHHARMMLQSTNQDILSIALSCGYETTRTFNREFKVHCGCTPREYRQKSHLHG